MSGSQYDMQVSATPGDSRQLMACGEAKGRQRVSGALPKEQGDQAP